MCKQNNNNNRESMEGKRHFRQGKVELTTCPDEWARIREVFVVCFRRYPLYKYMVPDDSKRDAFLRAYLDANYDVTAGAEEGIILAIKAPEDKNNNASPLKVVGGVMFVPPSSDGCGWAIGSDEPYWKAYEKHGLADISKEGLERVRRYEAWENENVRQRVARTKLPMWNGIFCAIAPQYASKGLGSAVYKDVMQIVAQCNARRTSNAAKEGFFSRISRGFNLKQMHRFTLLNHRAIPLAAINDKLQPTHNDDACDPASPLVAAISHSEGAASFHKSNGFLPVSRMPFHDADGSVPFYVHTLIMDPFGSGKAGQFGRRYARQSRQTPRPRPGVRDQGEPATGVHDDYVMIEM